ncbi:MAG TPA: cobaltochelatase subunit CobN, partial [Amaricoccus sp.]|uniref:cobaltochelatase subunit CobN n=1 Tax=Amaricoccus sp. TaxID=1872485 RepID=UPI002D19919A
MHILNVTTASLDDLIEPVDLGQAPAELVAASFSDSDLAALAGAWGPELPELRLAALRDLRHPMSVDLWIERVASGARAVLVRLLGGYDWWAYGCERLAAVARERGIALALLPGECRADDPRLAALSTVGPGARAGLLACFREGGPENMRAALLGLARVGGRAVAAPAAAPLPRVGLYLPGAGVRGLEAAEAAGRPLVAVLFYRSMLLANDHAPVDALVAALEAEGLAARAVFLPNLREPEVLAALEPALRRMRAAAIVTATAFAAGEEAGLFARLGVPVFQVVPATTRREAWAEGQRGLMPADLAMHVVLPELDGRILAGAVSFKEVAPLDVRLGLRLQRNRPEAGRVAQVARRVAAHLALAATPP